MWNRSSLRVSHIFKAFFIRFSLSLYFPSAQDQIGSRPNGPKVAQSAHLQHDAPNVRQGAMATAALAAQRMENKFVWHSGWFGQCGRRSTGTRAKAEEILIALLHSTQPPHLYTATTPFSRHYGLPVHIIIRRALLTPLYKHTHTTNTHSQAHSCFFAQPTR